MIVGQDRLYVECTEGVVVISEYPRHGCYVTFPTGCGLTMPSTGNNDVKAAIKCFMKLLPRFL